MSRDTSHTENTNRESMAEVSHTNPYTSESMGSLFEHGVTVVADGGERGAVDEDDATVVEAADATTGESVDADSMKDVSHEAPDGGHGNRMFERVGDTADVEDEG